MKKCFKCGKNKILSDFYKHKLMKDGHLNKCKVCTINDAHVHRNKNLEKIRAYDRCRGNRQSCDYIKNYREKYPNKYKAHTLVGNSVRAKKLFRESCEACESKEKTHAHHDDYLKPLNVRWLCPPCHKNWHEKNGEGLNP